MTRAVDDGRPDPRLSAALQRWTASRDAATRAEVLAALSGARVFLALAARSLGTEQSATTGLRQERATEMALLSVAGADGGRALAAFTDGHAVQRWQADARPVPVPGPTACATALGDGAVALLLDPPTAVFVVKAAELGELAAGRVPVPGAGVSTRRTDAQLSGPAQPPDERLVLALAAALDGEPVSAARLLDGPDGPVLGVVPRAVMSAGDLAGLAERVRRRASGALPPGGLDLAAVPPGGPGAEVPLRPARWWRRR
ncbi:MAG TPA: SseB family protein [Mycobacteriales bacterium]|nr:SseB family protein [Mycobacteriales bacterium]